MSVRKPKPELGEAEHADDALHVGVARPGGEGDGDVATASIDDSLSHDGTVFGHHVFVLVSDHLRVHFAERLRLVESVCETVNK